MLLPLLIVQFLSLGHVVLLLNAGVHVIIAGATESVHYCEIRPSKEITVWFSG